MARVISYFAVAMEMAATKAAWALSNISLLTSADTKLWSRIRFYESAVTVEAHSLATPFDVIADEGEKPDGGLEEVFEGRQPGRGCGA